MSTNLTLAQFDLFKNVSEGTLAEIAKISREFDAKKGEVIFKEGEDADKLHFLVSGNVALRVKLTSRPESVTVSVVNKQYESFGWSGVVPPYHYTAAAQCEEDSHILEIPGGKFMEILQKDTEDGFKVMQRITEIIASRLRNSRQALLKTL